VPLLTAGRRPGVFASNLFGGPPRRSISDPNAADRARLYGRHPCRARGRGFLLRQDIRPEKNASITPLRETLLAAKSNKSPGPAPTRRFDLPGASRQGSWFVKQARLLDIARGHLTTEFTDRKAGRAGGPAFATARGGVKAIHIARTRHPALEEAEAD